MRPPHAPARRGGALALRRRGGVGAQVPRPGLWVARLLAVGRLPSRNCATAAAAFESYCVPLAVFVSCQRCSPPFAM